MWTGGRFHRSSSRSVRVLHPADAVANKLCALFGRAEVRDYIDVHGVLEDGRFATTSCYGWRPITIGTWAGA